jgi:probable phosphoglycerate mutase
MTDKSAGRIILVRHGETEANRLRRFAETDDIPLSEAGRRQAEEVARRLLEDFRPSRLLSSKFLRARQTSEIIAQTLNLNVEILEGIHERNFGCLRGHSYERLGEMMLGDAEYDPARSWMWAPAGGESLAQVQRRAVEVLESLRAMHVDEDVVVVCHGAVIQAISAYISGEWTEASVPPNCGVVVLEEPARLRHSPL